MSSISRWVRISRFCAAVGDGGAPGSVTSIASAASERSSSVASSSASRASSSASSALRAALAPEPTGPRSAGSSSAIPRRIWVSSDLRPR